MDKPAGPGHGRGPPRKPLTLLVLAALRHMGAGVDYDDLEEVCNVSAGKLRQFIPDFIEWLATIWYEEVVQLPTGADLDLSSEVFAKLGFPGAFCSSSHLYGEPA